MTILAASDAIDDVLERGDLRTIVELLAERHGRVEALAAPGRQPLRFAELPAALAAIKAALNDRGIGRGDVVVIAAPNTPDVALWCVAITGFAIALPLNPAYSADECARYLGRIKPRAVIVPTGHASEIGAIARSLAIPVFELVVDAARPIGAFDLTPDVAVPCRDRAWNGREDVGMIAHTSGTTAQQKLVPARLRQMLLSARDMRRSFRLAPGDRGLLVMPVFHGHGMRAALLNPLLAGSTVVCVRGFAAADFFAQLRDNAITWYSASYAIHKAVLDLLDEDPTRAAGVRLRFIRSGSGKLPLPVMFGLEAALDTVVIERYGQTETGNVAVNPLPPRQRKPGTVGLPEGCELVVRSPLDFTPLPPGQEGEVTVRGPTVFDHYLDDPEATRAAFRDGWFLTGDLGRFDEDGFLTITGRIKLMINRGGEKVSPSEVEEALGRHPSIQSACAFSIPHPRLGEDVAAAVVPRPGASVDEDDLIAFAAASLADFKIPRRIYRLESLPLGATNKVDRRAVARACLDLDAAQAVGEAEATDGATGDIRRRLEPLWRSVLRRDDIPPRRDFFLLGGDSLSAAQLLAAVEREFGVALPLRSIFREARSLARMAAILADRSSTAASPAEPPGPRARRFARRPVDARIPLSFAQEQLWVHDRLFTGSNTYTISRVVRLRGRLDVAALEHALSFLIERHESLRLTIHEQDGVPYQVVHAPFPVPVPVTDLSNGDDPSREASLARIIEEERVRPFDLAAGPLLRVRVLRLAPEEHRLILALHHIVSDGGSMRAFARELAAAYGYFVAGAPALPPPLEVEFGDFAIWDRGGDHGRLESDLAFWRGQLAGVTEVELPTDRPRPRTMGTDGDQIVRALTRVDLARLRALARSEGGTLFGLIIATMQVFLHRLTGASDVVIGAPISRRSGGDLGDLIGLLVNILPIRQDLAGDPSFREMLRRTTGNVLGVIEHRDTPLTRILDVAGIRRSPDRHPLFQTVVGLAAPEAFELGLPGLECETLFAVDDTAKFDLQLTFIEDGENLDLRFHYDTTLFERETAERFVDDIEQLLVSVAAAPDSRISALQVMPEAQRARLLQDWSGARTLRPVRGTIAALFETQARAQPDAPAIVCGDMRITYRALDDWSTRLAHRLRAEGIRDGAIVGLAAGRTPALIAAQLAILKAGAAYLPLDAQLPPARVALIVEDAGASLVLAVDDAMSALPALRVRVVRLDPTGADLAAESLAPIAGGTGPQSLAYVMYTSGSAGVPKGVAVEQRGVIRLVCDTDYVRFGHAERFLQLGSVAFDAATFEIWGALLNGGCVVQVATPRPTLQEIARAVVDHRVTTAWFTAGLFSQLVDHVLDSFAGVAQVLTGGDVVSVSHARRFRAAHPGCRLINGYGPTETTTFATTHRIDSDADLESAIPIGRPIARTSVYVLDARRTLLPIGAVGELHIGGAGVARGYLNRPELTAERFLSSPFVAGDTLYRTGDLVRWRADGTLQFLGRRDRQVKLRGFRIELGEIETAIGSHPAIRQAVVALRHDAQDEARLVLYAVHAPGAPPPATAALLDFLRERLPGYMVPAAIVLLPELPQTSQGKIDLDALPAVDFARIDGASRVAPRDALESRLAAIWGEALGVPGIGIHDDFFDLGGHSLIAAKILSKIDAMVGTPLPLAALFEAPTIARFADLIREAKPVGPWSTAVVVQGKGRLPAVFAIPGIGGNVVCFSTVARHIGEDRPLIGLQPRGLDGTAAPYDRVESIAAHYVEQMRLIQPRGPYRILGVCIGGVFAYEMAQQLERAGEKVALLALIDPAFHRVASRSAKRRRAVYRVGRALGVAAFAAGRIALYAREIAALPVAEWGGYARRKAAVLRHAAAPQRLPNDVRREMAQRQVIAAHRAALEAYRPRPLAGDFVVFRSDDWENRSGRTSIDWRGITGRDVAFERVPGSDSGQTLYGSNARVLAGRLSDHLRRIDGA